MTFYLWPSYVCSHVMFLLYLIPFCRYGQLRSHQCSNCPQVKQYDRCDTLLDTFLCPGVCPGTTISGVCPAMRWCLSGWTTHPGCRRSHGPIWTLKTTDWYRETIRPTGPARQGSMGWFSEVELFEQSDPDLGEEWFPGAPTRSKDATRGSWPYY